MFKTARELLQAREIREALQLYWLELVLWPLAAFLTAFFTLWGGISAGAGCLALAGLARLRPLLTRLPSPDGRRELLDCRWSFGGLLFLAALVAAAAVAGWLVTPDGPAACALLAFLVLAAAAILTFAFALPLLLDHGLPWAVHLVLLREGGRLKTWHARLCPAQTAATEYLWLPDSRALLLALSDEDDSWYLYLFDPDAAGRAAVYPFNRIIGHYPNLRHVTLGEARARVAPILGLAAAPQGALPASTYEALCRRFFVWLNPQCVNH